MSFYSVTNKRARTYSSSGTLVITDSSSLNRPEGETRVLVKDGQYLTPVYGYVFDEKSGKNIRGVKSERDLRAFHNEAKEQTDINFIVQRYVRGEIDIDFSDWSSSDGVNLYDLTKIPTTFMEAQAQIAKGENYFSQLPLEIRQAFDYDSSKFLSASNDGSLKAVLESYIAKRYPVSADNVVAAKPVENSNK